jgi:hypothetical protein
LALSQSLATALAAGCSGRSTPGERHTAAAVPLTLASAVAGGGRRLDRSDVSTAVSGRSCSGEAPDGLFEVEFAPGGGGLLTPPDGAAGRLAWHVDGDGALCWDAGRGDACRTVVLYDGALRLFDETGQHRASLVCS